VPNVSVGGEEETAHILCKCEDLATFKHRYLDSFFLDPKGVKNVSLGTIEHY
jgi:hypothetical protein